MNVGPSDVHDKWVFRKHEDSPKLPTNIPKLGRKKSEKTSNWIIVQIKVVFLNQNYFLTKLLIMQINKQVKITFDTTISRINWAQVKLKQDRKNYSYPDLIMRRNSTHCHSAQGLRGRYQQR